MFLVRTPAMGEAHKGDSVSQNTSIVIKSIPAIFNKNVRYEDIHI